MSLRIGPHIELLRPLNSAMGAVAVVVGGVVASGPDLFFSSRVRSVALASLVAFLYIGAGNSLNDYQDRFTDRVNHPERPIPGNRIQPRSALRFSMALFVTGMTLALFIGWPGMNWVTLGIVALNSFLILAYEMWFKVQGFIGNLLVSWLTASLFLFGGAAAVTEPGPTVFPVPVLVLALLAFLSSVGREIIKGIEDRRGDRDRRTLPRVVGVRTAGKVAGLWIRAAVILSLLPVFPPVVFKAQYYLPTVLLADALFIYSIWMVPRNPGRASRTAKISMLLALAAFLLGAVTVRR